MFKNKTLWATLLFLGSVILLTVWQSSLKSYAQEELPLQLADCGQGYMGFAFVPEGEYEVYIDPGAMLNEWVTVSILDFNTNSCQTLVSVPNQNSIFKAGEITVPPEGMGGSFTIISAGNTGLGSTDAPKIIVRPKGQVCDPLVACSVMFRNSQFNLTPKQLSLKSDTLKIQLLQPIESDEISAVIYSVDKRVVYKQDTLTPFNVNYVFPGSQEIQRTVILKSGQTLSDSEEYERDFTPQNYIVATYYRHKEIINYFVAFFALLLVWTSVALLFSVLRRRKAWKQAHVAHVATAGKSKEEVLAWDNKLDILLPLKRGTIIVSSVVILFVVGSSFVLASFSVDGVSMYPTLEDKSTKLLLRYPITWAAINKRDYIPARGEIIVFDHADTLVLGGTDIVEKRHLVKRVIALPGERVVLRDGRLRVYNSDIPDGFDPDFGVEWSDKIESTPNQTFDIRLGVGELFVAGDNRPESVDSRNFGAIKTSSLVGVVPK